ncbi:MAG: hypothetical protein K1562_20140 [Candidatus Thiodiazotropha sp. (ex. Lucinisca nassula)]|nr:hypothetical protein [Candidatus Thiodiazotropha sp. (ex. Lucinisca nassula)]
MRILVINAGSSTVKYRIYDMNKEQTVATGLLERIGSSNARLSHTAWHADIERQTVHERRVDEHRSALLWILEVLKSDGHSLDGSSLDAIGHRIVHGGELFSKPMRIDDEVINQIDQLEPLAPLHNPASLTSIKMDAETAPELPQVAVFDTAFHQSLPPHAYRYAIPEQL